MLGLEKGRGGEEGGRGDGREERRGIEGRREGRSVDRGREERSREERMRGLPRSSVFVTALKILSHLLVSSGALVKIISPTQNDNSITSRQFERKQKGEGTYFHLFRIKVSCTLRSRVTGVYEELYHTSGKTFFSTLRAGLLM